MESQDQLANETKKEDNLEAVRGLIFTDGLVDTDKILCLHLLTTHAAAGYDDERFTRKFASSNSANGKFRTIPFLRGDSRELEFNTMGDYIVFLLRVVCRKITLRYFYRLKNSQHSSRNTRE